MTVEKRTRKPKKPLAKLVRSRSKNVIHKDLLDEFCERLIREGSVTKVCKDDDMPSKPTIFRWLAMGAAPKAKDEYKDFLTQYTAARKLAAEYSFDQLRVELDEIAMQPVVRDGVIVMLDGVPLMAPTQATIGMAKLHLDAFKWQSARENPSKYGDKIQQELVGKGGEALNMKVVMERSIAAKK